MAYTSFFRDPDALRAISDTVIPVLEHRREIRVWDAGCATGEEPFTLAILFASKLGPFTFRNLDILATDQEESSFPQFEDRIRTAEYSRKDIFWVPEDLRNKYFIPTDDPENFLVCQDIRDRVRYLKHDLLHFRAPETSKNLIVCKNVLMHFSPDDQVRVLQMFHAVMEPDSFLVLDGNQKMPPELASWFRQPEPGVPLFQNRAN